MKKFLFLVVLALLGYLAWRWGAPAPAVADAPAAGGIPGPSAPGAGAVPPPSVPAAAPADAPVPAEAKADLDKADALWKELEAAGTAPASSPQAPTLARLYTQVLKGLYNRPGQKALEDRLVETRLVPLGNELFFSRTRFVDDATGLMAMHTAESGSSPDRIAKQYGMSVELLNRLRNQEPGSPKLHAGDTLKVVKLKEKGGSAVHIDKGDYLLDLFLGGVFARRYVIAHGAVETPTPIGATRVTDRVFHPTWTHPKDHRVLEYGDPENILGPIWIPFAADGIGQSGIGIHGYTGADGKMSAKVSNGCIRMQNDQALELFHSIPHPERSPTSVEIVE